MGERFVGCAVVEGDAGVGGSTPSRLALGRAGVGLGPASEVRAASGAGVVHTVGAAGAAVPGGDAGHAGHGDRRARPLWDHDATFVSPDSSSACFDRAVLRAF